VDDLELVRAFLERHAEAIGADEVIEIGQTGYVVMRDTNGELVTLPKEFRVLWDNDLLQMAVEMYAAGNEGMLGRLIYIQGDRLGTVMMKREGAKHSSRSKYTPESKASWRKMAQEIWQRRPALSVTQVSERVIDGMAGGEVPADRTIGRVIKDLKPK
jgi:hypothetical protein